MTSAYVQPPPNPAPVPVRGVHGVHVLADLWGCDPALLDDVEFLEALVRRAAREAGATVLGVQVHHFVPQGATAIALLAESHLSIHTWPEQGYAAVDVFTCGATLAPEVSIAVLAAALGADRRDEQVVRRGHGLG